MSGSVAVPLWLFVALVAFALLAALEWLLLPGVRWYFRRKVRRVMDEIGTRFSIELPEFKLTRRRALIDRLTSDARVLAAVHRNAAESGTPRDVLLQRVDLYAREIVPAFNAYAYFRIGYWLAKTFARMTYRVRLGSSDAAALAAVEPGSTVVFVMNHRSNMDYVLVSFLAAERVALSYAVGEWARIWPLQSLIRAMGAYFVRRNSGDPLYRMVLQRYVQMATEGGVPQAMYPEGGLSNDGCLRTPKLGLLDYMLKGFAPDGERDLVFIPVGINYDRVLEDRSLLRKLDPAARRVGLATTATTTARFVGRQLALAVLGRRYRHGYACVNFGAPVSMRAWVGERGVDFRSLDDDARRPAVAAVGHALMAQIGRIIPVLPVPLVAGVLLREPDRPLAELELKAEVQALMASAEAGGAHVYVPRADRDYALAVGLRMLRLRKLVLEPEEGLFVANPDELPLLRYYANSIAHLDETAASKGAGQRKTGPAAPS
ncbi:MAG TPA: 1-acyl-sn-glycerol-3-phosphate acyltransferase [Caldimonas sp.]|nr:1-acyl-sn-glycerol-3-phosphate acyltransferase [Caldimonas sp.]HEX4235075.1 1-acyl-sn-glycerol-3-phosphate acyltransferase [Caldimonas sp.]